MVTLDIIFTYSNKPQQTVAIKNPNMDNFVDEDTFIAFLKENNPAKPEIMETIVKISTAIYYNEDEELEQIPKWYWDCKGKFYFDPKSALI